MLVLRKAQLKALEKAALQDFAGRAAAYLADREIPGFAAFSEVRLRETILRGTRTARAYGITREWDVCRFVELQLRHGLDLGARTDPEVARWLFRDDLDGTTKMDWIWLLFLRRRQHATETPR